MEKISMDKKHARIAGILYFIYIVVHIAADIIGRANIIVYGNASLTAENIISASLQYRAGFVIDLIGAVLFLFAAWALYRLLAPVNKSTALLFLLLNVAGVILQSASDLFLFAGQQLLHNAEYLAVFSADQVQSLSMLLLFLYRNGFMIAQVFYALWLFPLGYLVFKSGFLPKILGIVLMVHCLTWFTTALQYFLFPGFDLIFYLSYPLGFIAEFGLSLWLIVVGFKKQK
jgi:hypothetical protein